MREEVEAILEGRKAIKQEWNRSNLPLEVDSDSLKIINLINAVDSSLFDIQIFIEDIIFASKSII